MVANIFDIKLAVQFGIALFSMLGVVFALFKMLHRKGDERHADLKGDVRDGFRELRVDLKDIRTNIADVKDDVSHIKTQMRDFVTRKEHKESITRAHVRIDKVESRLDQLENGSRNEKD